VIAFRETAIPALLIVLTFLSASDQQILSAFAQGISGPIQGGDRIGFNQGQNKIRIFLVNCLNCSFKGAIFDLFSEIVDAHEGIIRSIHLFSSHHISLHLEETFTASPYDRS
jgi:hypothetical protein